MHVEQRVTTRGTGFAIAFLAVTAGCTRRLPCHNALIPPRAQQGGKLLIERGPAGDGVCSFDGHRSTAPWPRLFTQGHAAF
jgi:hypothetical protein